MKETQLQYVKSKLNKLPHFTHIKVAKKAN